MGCWKLENLLHLFPDLPDSFYTPRVNIFFVQTWSLIVSVLKRVSRSHYLWHELWPFYLRGTEKYSEFTYIPSQNAFLGLKHITGIALRPDWGTDPPFPGRWCRAWVPSPQAQTGSSLWPISNWATQQEVSGEQVSKASSVFTATLHHSHYCLNSAYSQRSLNPTVNCACKGSRLRVPYENLMPDDLSWSWAGAEAVMLGSDCKFRLSLAERFDCTEPS